MKPDRSTFRIQSLWRAFLFVLLFAFASVSIRAQNTSAGALSGSVKDTSGSLVPGAQVTVTNQQTHVARSATASHSGFYIVDNLPDGDYSLAVTASGFASSAINDIHLDPGQRRSQDVTLKPGSVDTKVTVEADTLAVQTESSENAGTISAKEVSNLMLNGRNFQQLATLVPGVSSVEGTNSQVNAGYLGQTDLIVGGASSEETTYTIDGVYDMTPTSLININITPSIDAINEIRVLKNSYSARYGFAGSGQIVIETKAGTSQFHGSGYEFLPTTASASLVPIRSLGYQPRSPACITTFTASPSVVRFTSPRSTTRPGTRPSSLPGPSGRPITTPPFSTPAPSSPLPSAPATSASVTTHSPALLLSHPEPAPPAAPPLRSGTAISFADSSARACSPHARSLLPSASRRIRRASPTRSTPLALTQLPPISSIPATSSCRCRTCPKTTTRPSRTT